MSLYHGRLARGELSSSNVHGVLVTEHCQWLRAEGL